MLKKSELRLNCSQEQAHLEKGNEVVHSEGTDEKEDVKG